MTKSCSIKGHIQFVGFKTPLMRYAGPCCEKVSLDLSETVMANYRHIKFSTDEKKLLTMNHRQIINYYSEISPFTLNRDAKELINAITRSRNDYFKIIASDYGAYICLAALYSGMLPENKKIELIIKDTPIALFPKTFMKQMPKVNCHKISYELSSDSWLLPFSSLYQTEMIKIKKAA